MNSRLRSASVAIRDASPSDASAILEIYTPYVSSTAVSFEEEPPTVEELDARIAVSHVWLVAEEGSSVPGYASAGSFHRRPAYRWSVEISIYVAEQARGRGIGAALLSDLLYRLREDGFVNAFAGTTLPNPASIALFESFGFRKMAHQTKVGFKLGEWHDVGWWQLQLREPPAEPSEPGVLR